VPGTADRASPRRTVELGVAGSFLLLTALWELVFNRLASYLGVYSGVGTRGPLAWLATSGHVAMVATGLMSIFLYWSTFARLINSRRFPGVWWRALLILISPVYQLVIMWSVFEQNIYPWLLLFSYVGAIATAVFVSVLAATRRISPGRRRTVLALGFMIALQAFAWVTLDFLEVDRFGDLGAVAIRAYLFSEVLMVTLPVIGFFTFFADSARKLGAFVRRPHFMALIGAHAATALAAAVVVRIGGDGSYLSQVAYLVVGVTVSIPGGPAVYLVALFFGALLVGCLMLPSRRWTPDEHTRRTGLGLGFIWIAGLQPYRVYQLALMLLGFLLLARGLSGERERGAGPAQESLEEMMRQLDRAPRSEEEPS